MKGSFHVLSYYPYLVQVRILSRSLQDILLLSFLPCGFFFFYLSLFFCIIFIFISLMRFCAVQMVVSTIAEKHLHDSLYEIFNFMPDIMSKWFIFLWKKALVTSRWF